MQAQGQILGSTYLPLSLLSYSLFKLYLFVLLFIFLVKELEKPLTPLLTPF